MRSGSSSRREPTASPFWTHPKISRVTASLFYVLNVDQNPDSCGRASGQSCGSRSGLDVDGWSRLKNFALSACPPMHPLTEAASSLEIHAGVAGECDDQGGGMRPGSLPHWRNFATLTGISESAVLDGHEMPLTRCPMPSPKNLRFRCHSWRTQEHFLHLVPRCCDATCTAWDIRPLNWRIAPHLGVFGDGFGVDHIHSSFYLIVRMYVW